MAVLGILQCIINANLNYIFLMIESNERKSFLSFQCTGSSSQGSQGAGEGKEMPCNFFLVLKGIDIKILKS